MYICYICILRKRKRGFIEMILFLVFVVIFRLRFYLYRISVRVINVDYNFYVFSLWRFFIFVSVYNL